MRIKPLVIDRYLFTRFFLNLFMALSAFVFIFIIVDVIEKIDKFLKYSMPLSAILLYYQYQVLFFISIATPMSLLLATIFTLGVMGKNNELTALKSSGISLYRVARPILILGMLFSVLQFIYDNSLVYQANAERVRLEKQYFQKLNLKNKKVFKDVMLQQSENSNIHIRHFDARSNNATGVNIHYFRGNSLKKRIDARRMKWLPEQQVWLLSDFQIREFDGMGNEKVYYFSGDSILYLSFRPEDITTMAIKPEEMNYAQLKRFIERLIANRIEPRKWQVNLHFKVAFAFTDFIVILLGIPLAVFQPRQGLTFGLGLGLFVIFLYYGALKFGQVLGFKGLLPPVIAAWLGNIIFITLGLFLLIKMRQ